VPGPSPKAIWLLGMHRSGTSIGTRMLALLGVENTLGEMIPPDEDNPKGYWESRALTSLNDRLLIALGCPWYAPADAQEVGSRQKELLGFDAEAHVALAEAFGTRTAVWKDPRLCVLWPYWKRLAGSPQAVVVIHRAPMEVADSLRRRNGFSTPFSLALWERHMRSALSASSDLPLHVDSYSGLLNDPHAWLGRVAEFLSSAGVDVKPVGFDVRQELLVPRAPLEEEGVFASFATPQQVELLAVLKTLEGSASAVSGDDLPPESATTTEVLRQAQALWREGRTTKALQRTVGELTARLQAERDSLGSLENAVEAAAASIESVRHAAEEDVARLEADLKQASDASAVFRRENDRLQRSLNNVLTSTSWRITAPLRRLARARASAPASASSRRR
jgi:hypothetical protein